MLDGYLVDSCQLVNTTRDDFGQEITGVTETLSCRWRDITEVRRGSNMDTNDAQSMVWFAAADQSKVTKGTILFYEGQYYQVDKCTKARRLGETTVQFVKCEVNVTTIGIS